MAEKGTEIKCIFHSTDHHSTPAHIPALLFVSLVCSKARDTLSSQSPRAKVSPDPQPPAHTNVLLSERPIPVHHRTAFLTFFNKVTSLCKLWPC